MQYKNMNSQTGGGNVKYETSCMNEHEIQFSSVGQRLREERLRRPRVAPSSHFSLGQSGWYRCVRGCGSNDKNWICTRSSFTLL